MQRVQMRDTKSTSFFQIVSKLIRFQSYCKILRKNNYTYCDILNSNKLRLQSAGKCLQNEGLSDNTGFDQTLKCVGTSP